MAGGEFAAVATCARCAGRAVRTYEGSEDDRYQCTACGYNFGIDWSRGPKPQKPIWPPSDVERQMILAVAAVVSSASTTTKEDQNKVPSLSPTRGMSFSDVFGARLRGPMIDIPTLWQKFCRKPYFPWLLAGIAFTLGRCSMGW